MLHQDCMVYGTIAGMFWLYVAFMLYASCAPSCPGPPEYMKEYAVTAFLFGWTSFMLALISVVIVPRMHSGKTMAAVVPLAGMSIWGIWILHRSVAVLPWPVCSAGRVAAVAGCCALQALQTVFFVGVVVLRRPLVPHPEHMINDK